MSITPKPSLSIWDKTVVVDWKKWLGSLARAAGQGISVLGGGNPAAVISSLVDGVLAFSVTEDVPGLAGQLIQRALIRAILTLLEESRRQGKLNQTEQRLQNMFNFGLVDLKGSIHLDQNFFARPAAAIPFSQLSSPLGDWLKHEMGLQPEQAAALIDRLPTYFILAVNEEWQEHHAEYEPLLRAINSPFAGATEDIRQWARYTAHLQTLPAEPIFNESFSLKTLFIPLRFFTETLPGKGEEASRREEKLENRSEAAWLEEQILAWVKTGNKQDAIRLICGGPGSGKMKPEQEALNELMNP